MLRCALQRQDKTLAIDLFLLFAKSSTPGMSFAVYAFVLEVAYVLDRLICVWLVLHVTSSQQFVS